MATTFDYAYAPDYSGFTEAATFGAPNQQQYDTASARIRGRVAGQQAGNARGLANQFAGRGAAFSGAADAAQRQNRQMGFQAASEQLGNYDAEFSKRQQDWANHLTENATARNNAASMAGNTMNDFLKNIGDNAGFYKVIADANPGQPMPWDNFWQGIKFPGAATIAGDVGGVIDTSGGGAGTSTGTSGTSSGTATGGTTTTSGSGDQTGAGTTTGPIGAGGPAGTNNAINWANPATAASQFEQYVQAYKGAPAYMKTQILQAYGGKIPDWVTAIMKKYGARFG